MKIYDYDDDKYYSEDEIRQAYLKREIEDIINNIDDYYKGFLNLERQCEKIKNIKFQDINNIIYELNCYWGYNLKIKFDEG